MKTVDNDLLTTYFRHNRMNKPTNHISMKGRYHISVSMHYLRWLIVNFDLFVLNLQENQDHLFDTPEFFLVSRTIIFEGVPF